VRFLLLPFFLSNFETDERIHTGELQQILSRSDIPSNHVQLAIDVGRGVVDNLREESVAAKGSDEEWEAFRAEGRGEVWVEGERKNARESGLGEVEVLEWGRRFMGMFPLFPSAFPCNETDALPPFSHSQDNKLSTPTTVPPASTLILFPARGYSGRVRLSSLLLFALAFQFTDSFSLVVLLDVLHRHSLQSAES
jgi:hypothetical protein